MIKHSKSFSCRDQSLQPESELELLRERCEWFEARCRQLVETADNAFFALDDRGAVVDWNAGAARLLGWKRDEVVARPATETLFPLHLFPEELNNLESSPQLTPLRGQRLRASAMHRDGGMVPVGLVAWSTPLRSSCSINAFMYDIRKGEQSADERCSMALFVDSSGDGIIGTSTDGTIHMWNPAAEELLGYHAEEVIGQPISVVVPLGLEEEAGLLWGKLLDGAPVEHHDTVLVRSDGKHVEVGLTVSVIRNRSGVITGFSTIARDISDQKRVTTEVESTLRGLEAALQEAREAQSRGRNFLADVAHQLRSPLAGIQASAETLRAGVSGSAQDGLLSGIAKETTRAARLLTALLHMERLEEGQALVPGPVDLVELCREEAGRVTLLAPQLAVLVREEGQPTGKVQLDAGAVREILANLLDNARRHARTRIEVVIASGSTGPEVWVLDDGPGVNEAMASRIFDRFVSLDRRGGSGLGLPIARGLARAHGGDVTYENRAFVVRLGAPREASGS